MVEYVPFTISLFQQQKGIITCNQYDKQRKMHDLNMLTFSDFNHFF